MGSGYIVYQFTTCQTLYAYDATNLGTMLYNGNQAAVAGLDGGAVYAVPTVANGGYVGNQDK
jgi:hypothetical protein